MSKGLWINTRRWDLTFLSLSVLLIPIPYTVWLIMRDVFNVDADLGRQIVNIMVILVVAGPHTYATFTRTMFDHQFRKKHRAYYLSSFIIPLIVIVLALANLPLLLTIFFFWASLHTWHQIIFVVDSYHEKERLVRKERIRKRLAQFVDYGPVLVGLYPLAAYRIAVTQDFAVGPNSLNDVIPSFFERPWLAIAAIVIFLIALFAFIVKSAMEIKRGTANMPKILFIAVTVIAFFFIPSLSNLDTALQGVNVWHCTQYLALTWYINRLREDRGEIKQEPLIERISKPGHAREFYLFNVGLTLGSMLLIVIFFVILFYGIGGKWSEASYAFETSYYIGVLAFLWIHYYQDHFLFTKSESVLP
jgi:membrane protein insertase Oxa1/YidC/SpoIIIJ